MRLFVRLVLTASVVCLPPAGTASAASGLSCSIDQTRTFTPPLGSLSGPAPYTFTASGTITCDGVADGEPLQLTGTISVGNRFATPSEGPDCNTWSWQEPAGELFGTPASNTTTETRFIRWYTGEVTILELGNDDITYLKLDGSNTGTSVARATVPADTSAPPCPGQPSTATVTATRAVGAQVRGALWAVSSSCGPGPGCRSWRLVGADAIGG